MKSFLRHVFSFTFLLYFSSQLLFLNTAFSLKAEQEKLAVNSAHLQINAPLPSIDPFDCLEEAKNETRVTEFIPDTAVNSYKNLKCTLFTEINFSSCPATKQIKLSGLLPAVPFSKQSPHILPTPPPSVLI